MMKKNHVLIFSTILLVNTINIAVAEQTESGPYIVAPSVGYYFFDRDNNNNADDGVFYGIGAGYQINKHFAIEGNYARLNSETKNPAEDQDWIWRLDDEKVNADMYRLDAIFSLDLNSDWAPYVAVGYTRLEQSPQFGDDDDMMSAALGIKRKITPTLSIRAEARTFHNFDNEDTDYAVNAALVYRFGAEKPAPIIPVVIPPTIPQPIDPCSLDDDGDGVNNCDDKCANTPADSRIEVTGCRILEVPVKIRLEVLFDYNKAIVKEQYFSEIQKVADFMRKYPSTNTEIQGHTDSRGSDAYNQDLSQRRADAVREVLVSQFSIDPSRLSSVGYGESRLLVNPELTDLDYQMNRRVMAHIETVVEKVEGSF
ncbi:OmpA family protein [Candidatus Marithrix sp. Canyon 246]|uniref:OmpA family protein n=2 Tax=Candidatus Marithrix sp. Canyon 246 TaxID=1827136 RepID=UPI00084A1D79|nr:OmpA family protein [Candidatus Marithrix sp. Canyon 246]